MANEASVTLRTRADLSGVQQFSTGIDAGALALSRQALAAGNASEALRQMDAALGKVSSAEGVANAQTLQMALSEARLSVALGDRRRAMDQIEGALAQQTERTAAVIRAETILTQIENQEAAAAKKAADETMRLASARAKVASQPPPAVPKPQTVPKPQAAPQSLSFGQAVGAFGLAQIGPQLVGQAISKSIEVGGEALQLRETKNALKAVAGDTQTYNTILKSAREQQLLFGGSLQANVEGLSGLAITSRNTGASLTQLIDLQKRLVVLNPAQGAQGGLIALNEALAGNITSLSRRFNIPKAALKELNDTTKPVTERLKVLDDFLTKVGITSAAVTGKVDADALAFRRLGQELGDIKLSAGSELATAFSGAATGLARLLGVVNNNPQAIAELKALLSGKGQVTDADVASVRRTQAESFADRAVRPAQTPDNPFASEATRNAPDLAVSISKGAEENAAAVAKIRDQLVALNLAGDDAAIRAQALADQFSSGAIGATQFAADVSQLTTETFGIAAAFDDERKAIANASSEARTHFQEFIGSAHASAEASTLDAEQKKLQLAMTSKLGFETDLAADAFLKLNPNLDASQAFALAAAQGLGPLVQGVIALRIEADKTRAALLGEKLNAQTSSELKGTIAFGDRADITANKHAGVVEGRARGQAAAAATAEAQRQADAASGNLAPALSHAQAELNQLAKDGKTNTAAYIEKQQQITDLQAKQTAQGQKTLGDQIAYAKATDDTATARKLLNQELSGAKARGDLGEQARILEEIKALDKKKGAGESKGLGALDRDAIALADDYQSQLDVVNKQLQAGNLTQHQRNQLLIKAADLEEKITKEKSKQADATIDARIASLENQKERIDEEKRLRGASAILAHPEQFSDEQRKRAAIVSQEIPLQEQKRDRDVAKKVLEGGAAGGFTDEEIKRARDVLAAPIGAAASSVALGGAAAAPGAPFTPAPGAAPGAPPGQAAAAGATIIFQFDQKTFATALVPDVNAFLRSGVFQLRAAGG